jgi:hypothetical protein
MANDADAIRAEVERRKRRANELQVPSLVADLYHDLFQNYPAWAREYPDRLPKLISELEHPTKRIVEFTFKRQKFSFFWKEESSERISHNEDSDTDIMRCRLILRVNEKRVFEMTVRGERYINVRGSQVFASSTWKPVNIQSFVEGPWIDDLREIDRLGRQYLQMALDKTRNDPSKLADLKKRFGID